MGDLLYEVCASSIATARSFSNIKSSGYWDQADTPEAKIHRIHSYPAKFPAFLTKKALSLARSEGIEVQKIADVFCGCGTVAQEAASEGIEFWGCDINPVATLIAKTKSSSFDPKRLRRYANQIESAFKSASENDHFSAAVRERLLCWYAPSQYVELVKLLNAIQSEVPERSKYRLAFFCAFSAILKKTSLWRARSTKPLKDPTKQVAGVMKSFNQQCEQMAQAWEESPSKPGFKAEIFNSNVLEICPPKELVDLIVTSPPYVVSYEYADLHQLSSLWLGYAEDHRILRKGSIGSSSHTIDLRKEFRHLNKAATQIVFSLYAENPVLAKAVANYYLNMQDVAKRCMTFLAPKGMAFFVIGDTEYGGVKVNNSAHFAEALFDAGFQRVRVAKRAISNKANTPFRGDRGRFSNSPSIATIYSEEFILVAER